MRHVALILFLGLAACSDGSTRLEFSQQVALGHVPYIAPSLEQARVDFVGPTTDTDGGFFFGGLQKPIVFADAAAFAVSAALVKREEVGQGVTITSRLAAEHGQTRAFLPDGIDILTDPMRVEIMAETLRVEVEADKRVAFGQGWGAELSAGMGLQHTATHSRLNSALIALESRKALLSPYATLGATLGRTSGLAFTARTSVFTDGEKELRLGLLQRF